MANTLLHKRKTVSGQKPLANEVSIGEVTLNTADGKMFLKLNSGAVISFSSDQAPDRSIHNYGTISGNVNVDFSNGEKQQATLNADTDISFINWLPSGNMSTLTLFLNITGGSNFTFPGVTTWASKQTPTLETGLNELVFTSIDGGTKVIGHVITTGA